MADPKDEKPVIAAADRSKRRFRAFLGTDCQHFLVDGDRRKRVRFKVLKAMLFDADDAENRYRFEPARPLVETRRLTRGTRWPETDGEIVAIP